jgi:hypothetical protein
MHLHDALCQIAEIRTAVDRSACFRGYRAAPVAASGALAAVAALIQFWTIDEPLQQLAPYLALWIGTAGLSLALVMAEVVARYGWSIVELRRSGTCRAAGYFAPCLFAGILVTTGICEVRPDAAALLPGLWSILFSFGAFASRPVLPRQMIWIGVWYLLAGWLVLMLAQGPQSLAPWAMFVPFGIGQMAAAAVLYWQLERSAHSGD